MSTRVSHINNKQFDCVRNSMFRLTTNKTTKLQLTSPLSWCRHQMEAFSALLAICAGNSPVTGEFPHKGQWRGALMFSLICAWINGWVNNGEAGNLRRHRAHYDVIVIVRGIHQWAADILHWVTWSLCLFWFLLLVLSTGIFSIFTWLQMHVIGLIPGKFYTEWSKTKWAKFAAITFVRMAYINHYIPQIL